MNAKLAAGIAALAFILAACGGSTTAGTTGSTSSPAATPVTVGYVPYSDDVALFVARDKGFFARHGLDVTLAPAANPVAVVSSMVSGQ